MKTRILFVICGTMFSETKKGMVHNRHYANILGGFPNGSGDKESARDAGDTGDPGSIPGLGRSPGGGKWQPTPVFLPGEFHGQRNLVTHRYSLRELRNRGVQSSPELWEFTDRKENSDGRDSLGLGVPCFIHPLQEIVRFSSWFFHSPLLLLCSH